MQETPKELLITFDYWHNILKNIVQIVFREFLSAQT